MTDLRRRVHAPVHTPARPHRRAPARLLPAVLALALAGCVAPPGTTSPGSSGGGPATPPGPGPDAAVWFVGDSIADRTARTMPSQPYPAARDGASFTELPFGYGTITANTLASLGDDHRPGTVLVMGGANDVLFGVPYDRIIEEMMSFEEQVQALGIGVRWVLEPQLAATGGVVVLNEWLLVHRPGAIDCREFVGPSLDGIHPVDYSAFALCVDDALVTA